MASAPIMFIHDVACSVGFIAAKMRATASSVAAFGATDSQAATGVGPPWYTSGAHGWNGASESLKPKPAMSRTKPVAARGLALPLTPNEYAANCTTFGVKGSAS